MTSVDSGVETGNDSNDSSIVQHENHGTSQVSNVSSTVAAATNSQVEINETESSTVKDECGPVWPMGWQVPVPRFHLPLFYPVIGNGNYGEEGSPSIAAGTSGAVVDCTSKLWEFRFPPMYYPYKWSTTLELLKKKSSYHRKMKSLHASRRNYQYLTLLDVEGHLIERKMRLAAATNNTMIIRRLLNSGVSPNNHDEQGRTPLHLASCRGYTEMVRLLLEHGADPNKRDCLGNTPLHLAAVTSKISVVTLLLKAGTNVLTVDHHGYSPLQLAQTKLRMLRNCKGTDMLKVKEEVHNVVGMLLAYLQKQKAMGQQIETLSNFCSRLSLSNTSDQVQDDVKDLLANINALSITNLKR
ncbi:hypothetical protein KM043_017369 [Ampulex compressa]|nr:hypothetical protein KM043_017369 [Ampulex compressa]